MKRLLFILWLAVGTTWAADTNVPPPALFAPNVTRVERSGNGYWLTFADGKRAYAAQTASGYRVEHRSGRAVYVDRTNDGWRETESGKQPRYWSRFGTGYSGEWNTESDRSGVSTFKKGATRPRRFQKSAGSWSSVKE